MKRLAVVLAAMLLLSACKVRVNLDSTLNENGSGTIAFAVGFDKEFRDAMEQFTQGFGGEGEGVTGSGDLLADMEDNVPEGWDFERFSENGFEGGRISREFESLEHIQKQLSDHAG